MNEITLNRPVKSVFIPLENRLESFYDKQEIQLQIQAKCDKSYNEGYEAGIEQGRREQEAVSGVEMQMLKQHFQNVMSSIPNQMKQAFIDVEDMAAALCLNIAKKVIHKEIEHKEHIITLIRKIIKNISDKTTLTIRMNPFDLQMLREEGLEIELAKDVTTLNIVEDMEINRGGCIIEHNLGQVNAKIEDQIAALDRSISNQFTLVDQEESSTAPEIEDIIETNDITQQTPQSMDAMLEEVLSTGLAEEASMVSGDVTSEQLSPIEIPAEPNLSGAALADSFNTPETASSTDEQTSKTDTSLSTSETDSNPEQSTADEAAGEEQLLENPENLKNNLSDDVLGTDNADKTDVDK